MQVEIYKIYYSNYKFVAELDTGAEVGTNQVTLWFSEKEQHDFGELSFLRSFYFEEANYDNIHTFCREFAQYPNYRQEILSGQRHWTKRNALFIRNLYSIVGESALLANDTSFERKAREFFRWTDIHTDEIVARPIYQQLQNLDSSFQPNPTLLDPFIQPAVALLNQIPGVATRFSCQGVSGKVPVQEYEIMAVSPHAEYAYVSFSTLSYFAHDAIIALLPQFPHITNTRIPCNFSSDLLLRSTGDNQCFRAELLTMAQCMLTQGSGEKLQLKPAPTHWETCDNPERQPCVADPGGMLPSRCAWLCQAGQIEHTLHLLFHLNHWAKASEYLFYADRQGLYTVKAALIQQAYTSHHLQPVTYIDGIATFAKDFSVEVAADIAAEFLIDHLTFLYEKEPYSSQANEYDTAARQLFQRISGRSVTCSRDIETIKLAQAEEYICITLYNLIEQARLTRQPIPHKELSALLIGPTDLLAIPYTREHLIEYWHDLDEASARKLDPEGNSLIVFRYTSPTASYTFHLPFRVAERFLTPECLQLLRLHAGHSREQGSYYGRAITEAESYEYSITEILRELAVNIDSICQHRLARKEEAYASSVRECWDCCVDSDEEYDDEDDDDEDYITYSSSKRSKSKRRNKHRAQRHLQPICPLCKCCVTDAGLTPIAHWYYAHLNQDLTIGQATWVLRESEMELKNAGLKPDYHGPTTQPGQKGTRYWKLATLQTYVAKKASGSA